MKTALFVGVLALTITSPALAQAKKPKLPNIVWITSEDHGPHLGCYGDKIAVTPNIDKLAKKGMRFRLCWSNAPVCAPARTSIITGMYPTSTGSEHMRSLTRLPADIHMFPYYLRTLGYYCTNKVKEDYNLEKGKGVWDDSSNKAHWKNRKPGQPFFAVFNSTKSHESQIRNYKKAPKTDAAKISLPAYHPDIPEARTDWANYYDNLTKVDADAAEIIRELEEAGLLEDTIIIYFADHGSGMPRNKRTPLNSGLHVPFIIAVPDGLRHLAPEGYKTDGVSNRLISFVDLGPTMLSLAGAEPPAFMQGRAFSGKHATKDPDFVHGFRGRMDERYDLQRSVTNGRFVYMRNYLPHLPAGQHVEYMFQTRTTAAWKKLFDAGKLTEAQSLFWRAPRPAEELYDLGSDPDEVQNLAGSKLDKDFLAMLRKANRDHILAVRDVGLLPEDEIHTRSKGSTPYQMARDPKKYPLERILDMAELASDLSAASTPKLAAGASDEDSAVRYWAVLGLLMRGDKTVVSHEKVLEKSLADAAPSVRVAAAEALAQHGGKANQKAGLDALLSLADPKKNSVYISLAALNALDRLGDKARPGLATIAEWPTEIDAGSQRSGYGIARLINKIREQLK